ncbi:MAG: PQQ-binding-like beta-propeller repeat protein, partial [Pirellulaceae bacterium]
MGTSPLYPDHRFQRPIIMNRLLATSVFLSLATTFLGGVVGADWPQFRGRNSSGVSTGRDVPTKFGPGNNERWSVPMQPGHSSPCIAGDLIFLTTFDKAASQVAVICLDRHTGATRWQRAVHTGRMEKGHPSFNPASSSPASDGERVVAYFGSHGLVCFDIKGKKLWDLKMPVTKSFGGNATSPIIAGNRVILYRGNYVDHFLLAVDKTSGKEAW